MANTTTPKTPETIGASTTARQWLVLTQLERGKWMGTTQIHKNLKMHGHDVTLRTVQRDLNTLAKRFKLEKNNANPQGWRWHKDAPQESFPNLNLSQAVAFSMVAENLAHLLPPSIVEELNPWFDLANRQVRRNDANKIWLNRVRIEPANQPLIAPKVDIKVKNNIYRSVFEQNRIQAKYKGANQQSAKNYYLNPLAIIQRGVVIYVLATKVGDDTHSVRTFALHRFTQVTILENEPAVTPKEFDLDTILADGVMGFSEPVLSKLPKHGKHTDISLTLTANAAHHLTESKLSKNQTINNNEDGTITITATVNLTSQLVWWLRGFGKELTNIQPAILSQVVNETAIA